MEYANIPLCGCRYSLDLLSSPFLILARVAMAKVSHRNMTWLLIVKAKIHENITLLLLHSPFSTNQQKMTFNSPSSKCTCIIRLVRDCKGKLKCSTLWSFLHPLSHWWLPWRPTYSQVSTLPKTKGTKVSPSISLTFKPQKLPRKYKVASTFPYRRSC